MTKNESSIEECQSHDHVSIKVTPQAVVAGFTNVATSSSSAQQSSHSPDVSGNNVEATSIGGDPVREPPQRNAEPTVVTVADNNVPKRKCPQFCPTNLSSFFVGLGKLITGYHLHINLPNLAKFKPQNVTGSSADSPRIPFENLEEETRHGATLPQPAQEASVKPNSSPIIRVNFQWPFFIVLTSLSQWAFFHFVMKDEYNGWFSANLEFTPLKRYEVWRFLTATWIHGTTTHLNGNLRLQLIAGCCLEVVHGWQRVCYLYFGGVIFANLTTSVAEPFLRAYGASGGVYALLTGHLASVILNWHECWGASNRGLLVLIYLLLSVAAAFNQNITQNSLLPAHHIVGHAAHVGGALGGLLIGLCVLKNFRPQPWEIKISKICTRILVVLLILGIGGNISDQIFYWKSIKYVRQRNLTLSVNKMFGNAKVYKSPSDVSFFLI